MNEILKIIVNCKKEQRLFNDEEIKTITNTIIKLNDYYEIINVKVKDKCSYNKKVGGRTEYDTITFYKYGMNKLVQESVDELNSCLEFDCTEIDRLNYIHFENILHEIAHGRQHYIIYDTPYWSLEKALFTFAHNTSQEFTDENYEIDLLEHNARNVARVNAYNIYSKLPKGVFTEKDMKSFQIAMASNFYIDSYDILYKKSKVLSPSEKIYKKLTNDECEFIGTSKEKYLKLITVKNLTIYKKYMLGLPISIQEYAYANLMYDAIGEDSSINFCKRLQIKMK